MKPATSEWVAKAEGDFELLKADLDVLEEYSVRYRYPGDTAEKEEAKATYKAVKVVREFLREKLEIQS